MERSPLVGGCVGGIVLFVWGAVSWMVLPWHHTTLNTFTNEDEVATVLRANAPGRGISVYPGEGHEAGLRGEEQKKAHRRAMEKMQPGPCVLVSLTRSGVTSMAAPMMFGFVNQVFAALRLTGLLLGAHIPSDQGPVTFTVGVTFTAGVLGHLPSWNGWGLSAGHTVVMIADLIVAALLRGLIWGKVVKPPIAT